MAGKGRTPDIFASPLISLVLARFGEMKKGNKLDFWKMTCAWDRQMPGRDTPGKLSMRALWIWSIFRAALSWENFAGISAENMPEVRVFYRVRSPPKGKIGQNGRGVQQQAWYRQSFPDAVSSCFRAYVCENLSIKWLLLFFFYTDKLFFPPHFILGDSRTVLTETFPNKSAQDRDIG